MNTEMLVENLQNKKEGESEDLPKTVYPKLGTKFFVVLFIFLGVCAYFRYVYLVHYYIPMPPTTKNIRSGQVVSNPSMSSSGQSFVFKAITPHDSLSRKVSEKILVRTSDREQIEYGDTLTLSLDCQEPKNFETDQGTIFDYECYLKKDHIYSICTVSGIQDQVHHRSFQKTLFHFADLLADRIQALFKSPHSDFIGGVLVGDKTGINPAIRNDFIKTGTIHVLALSGYNIAIVALFFSRFFGVFLRRRKALVISALCIILFVAMTGFASSAIRAGIMALVVILAAVSYQKYSPIRALLVASVLMILYDPFYLLYDSSFHLSFLATFGIISYSKTFELLCKKVPTTLLRTTIATTLSAYIMTVPYLLYFFQGISLTGVIANILVVPLVPILMLASFLALVTSLVSFSFAYVSVIVSEGVSSVMLFIIHAFAQIPFGYMTVEISFTLFLILYGVVLGGMEVVRMKMKE